MQHFHTVPKEQGYAAVPDQSCSYLDFGTIRLDAGGRYEGNVAGDREALMVVLGGKARVKANGTDLGTVGRRPNVFAGVAHAVYLPRGAAYVIEAEGPFEAALPQGPSSLDLDPYVISPEQVNTGQWGTLNYTRYFREILVQPNGMPASSLIVGETITPSGNWSTYPPHKHEVNAGAEKFHEEMYYFRVSSPDSHGVIHHYSPERGYDDMHKVTDDTLIAMPHGYHTYVGAPGAQSYYLWALAGNGRAQGASFDPKLGWVQKTVGMV
ncbi:5-deoxy-glucuronate isomerase [Roseobacter weihaiensis]|uniref:5-deoxy-glucuronate isomerase n=1 Tax=Roseobacter weihaiensis TaxID=2763262 RepID=UPI001D0AEA02|nr:5-deoxy-glucuronate isomerase [Roseobacter sp. H9]